MKTSSKLTWKWKATNQPDSLNLFLSNTDRLHGEWHWTWKLENSWNVHFIITRYQTRLGFVKVLNMWRKYLFHSCLDQYAKWQYFIILWFKFKWMWFWLSSKFWQEIIVYFFHIYTKIDRNCLICPEHVFDWLSQKNEWLRVANG